MPEEITRIQVTPEDSITYLAIKGDDPDCNEHVTPFTQFAIHTQCAGGINWVNVGKYIAMHCGHCGLRVKFPPDLKSIEDVRKATKWDAAVAQFFEGMESGG